MPRISSQPFDPALVHPAIESWFEARGWTPFPFQRKTWLAIAGGRSVLLHATTGAGKTYAVWLGLLNLALRAPASEPHGLRVLWITPMRALAADTTRALNAPVNDLHLAWSVGARTGDTGSAERARQSTRWPTALVTTPESLSDRK